MNRRKFLQGTGFVAGAAATTLAAPAIVRASTEWLCVTAFGKAGLLGNAIEEFAKFVTSASNGALTIRVYHGGELVKPLEAMDAVQAGSAQMGFGAPYYWAGKSEAISFIAAQPFGLNAQEQNAWLYYAGGLEQADKIYAGLGLKFLPLGNTGNQMGGWYRKEINTVADLKGLKFRMPGLGGEILKSIGVNVVLLPADQVLSSLTTGAIDGTEWIGPAADMGMGLYKVCNNYYYPGWHEPATVLDGFFDLQAWEALTPELKAIVTQGAAASNLNVLSKFQAVNNEAMQKLIREHGVHVRRYSDELIDTIAKQATIVLPEIANRSKEGKEVWEHIVNFRRTMMEWSGYSELAFMQNRGKAQL
jgi:TRAP-type mannitol/chloroaromatic compound transport system substrate-binding protein